MNAAISKSILNMFITNISRLPKKNSFVDFLKSKSFVVSININKR